MDHKIALLILGRAERSKLNLAAAEIMSREDVALNLIIQASLLDASEAADMLSEGLGVEPYSA